MKECRKCNTSKAAECFSADSRNKDGLQAYCRKCVASNARNRRECPEERKIHLAKGANYKALQRGAKECSCCSKRDILQVYMDVPDGMTVDHIVEIHQGGEHCTKNLQYLTRSDNIRKSWKHRRAK